MTPTDRAEDKNQLRRMWAVSRLEGSTLLLLVLVAMPLKHLAGYPIATAIVGPMHGLAFLLYLFMLIQTWAAGDWSRRDTARMFIAAFIPFGAFFNERLLKRRQAALASSQ